MWGEPKRQSDVNLLEPYVADRVKKVIVALKARGFDPIVFESRRTEARQRWLYSIGRTTQKNRKPVTWTMKSLHIHGKAADIISKKHGWNDPPFFEALAEEAVKVGMHTLGVELCHIQWK